MRLTNHHVIPVWFARVGLWKALNSQVQTTQGHELNPAEKKEMSWESRAKSNFLIDVIDIATRITYLVHLYLDRSRTHLREWLSGSSCELWLVGTYMALFRHAALHAENQINIE
jgi:hypothetical protein